MSASSVAMMMGATVSAAQAAADGKVSTGGKSFAASLGESIAAGTDVDTKAATEMSTPQIQTGSQAVVNGAVQGAIQNPATTVNSSQAPDGSMKTTPMLITKAPEVLADPVQKPVVTGTVVKAPGISARTVEIAEKMQPEHAPVVQRLCAAVNDPVSTEATPLADASIATPDAVKYGSGQQQQVVKLQSSSEIPPIGKGEGNVSPAQTAGANAKTSELQPESAAASPEKNISKTSPENASPAKDPAKQHGTAKTGTPSKAIDVVANAGTAYAVSPAVCRPAVVSMSSLSCNATDSKSQAAIQSASKQVTAPAAMAGKQTQMLAAGTPQQSGTQHGIAAEKPSSDGSGVLSHPGTDAHVTEKNTQAIEKPVTSPPVTASSQATKLTAGPPVKPSSADAAHPATHPTGTAGVVTSVPGGNTPMQSPIATAQRSAPGNPTASLLTAHSGNGELSGASGAQTAVVNETHKTLVSTPTVLEVGIPNGTQGWLKVRAELTGGGINASLSAALPAGQEMLHRELPALSAFLQQEKVSVSSLVVQAPVAGGSRDLSGGAQSYTGGQAQRQNQGRGGRENFATADNTAHTALSLQGADELPAAMQYPSGGGWLSVRA